MLRKLIMATHGKLSKGMLNSVTMIVGDLAKDIETYSLYPGESPDDYYHQLKSRVEEDVDTQYVIVCDIKGGSVHTTLSKLVSYSNVVVISGMNMNIMLDLVLTYQNGIKDEDYLCLLNSAKQNMTILSNSLLTSKDEDF